MNHTSCLLSRALRAGADGSWIALMGDGGSGEGSGEVEDGEVTSSSPGGGEESGGGGGGGGELAAGGFITSSVNAGEAQVDAEAESSQSVAAISPPRPIVGAGPLRPHAFKVGF